ncbi:glycosyltransferase [Tsuneonella amylolytica]|uniref:glycosyltransferase n=1 Tax=Tsuneonella amylolytica TaxID=2338327 RepID=UPI000EA989B7|nr:glycosyltransferase [Tsuneonella amylolytica]
MEAHCATLCAGLVERGHEVILFAAPGSGCAGEVRTICEAPYEDVLPWHDWHGTPELNDWQRSAYARAWDAIGDGEFDVVHNNTLFPALIEWARSDGVPMLTSQHVPPFGRMHDAVIAAAGDARAQVSVTSASQVPLWFDEAPANLSVVHNGIDTAWWSPAERGERLVWSGRITANKGTDHALEAARRADVALDIVGTIEDAAYFAAEVEPLLDERRRYLGHLSAEALREAIAGAAACVVTPMWPEPFGLVAAEALSCDVPVIAYANGAMAEVVGPAGILVPPGDIDALAAAMRAGVTLDPGAARQRALDLFSIPTMIAGYERLYDRAKRATALAPEPVA